MLLGHCLLVPSWHMYRPYVVFNVPVQVYEPEPEGELLSSKLTLGRTLICYITRYLGDI